MGSAICICPYNSRLGESVEEGSQLSSGSKDPASTFGHRWVDEATTVAAFDEHERHFFCCADTGSQSSNLFGNLSVRRGSNNGAASDEYLSEVILELDDKQVTERHLILNMDVNKTILMIDKVSKKSAEMCVNEVLADAAWGQACDGKWVVGDLEPSVYRPTPGEDGVEFISYNEWLAEALPGATHKKSRSKLAGNFTHRDEPGEVFAACTARLSAQLMNTDGSPVQILMSFFELLLTLKRQGRSFSICFRTFGEDLESVAEEMNMFCEGRHPRYPGVYMDGSDGSPDYRVALADQEGFGTFYQDDNVVSLIMGTLWQPENEPNPSMKHYDGMAGLKIVPGPLANIEEYLRAKLTKPGTLALRDYFLYWKRNEMSAHAGKIFCFRGESNVHEIFFDDNIRPLDAFIINAVDMLRPTAKPLITALLRTHLCRAEPLHSIFDRRYFVNEVARMEEAYGRTLEVRKRMAGILKTRRARAKLKDVRPIQSTRSASAWQEDAIRMRRSSMPVFDSTSSRPIDF